MQDTGSLHTQLDLLRAEIDDPPIHPPLRGQDSKAAFYSEPGTAEALVEHPVFFRDVGTREGTHQVPTQRESPPPGHMEFSRDDWLLGARCLQGSQGCRS